MFKNGRRYYAFREGAYVVPNDDDEQDRMDMLHHIYLLILGGRLHRAPISPNSQRVLNLGTGTGIWAIQFADEYPSAQVIGTDLSPIQPQWINPNCTFEVDDFETDWIYSRPFDFIHPRELCGCVKNHEKLFVQAFEHLKPGGYFEMQGVDPYFVSDDGTHENAGFVDVHDDILKMPIGTLPKDPTLKEVGKYQQVQQIIAADSYTPALFTRVLAWDKLEIDILLSELRSELKDRSFHLYLPVHFVYGNKPERLQGQ